MKKKSVLLLLILLLVLSGCRKREPEPEAPVVPEQPPVTDQTETEQSALREIHVEISRNGLSPQQLADAVKTLPELLKTCLQEAGAEVETVKVTVGTSAAATAQTLAAGNIELAFLPVEAFLLYGGEAVALYADGYEAKGGSAEGASSLICAAPTEYGAQLAQRADSDNSLSWEELERARWGVLAKDSLNGYRSLDLWLADNYEGNRLTELPDVTVYESYEALLRAAAAEEIDAFVIRNDVRTEAAEAWMLDLDRTNDYGVRGFGRTESVWDEVPVLAVTESVYSVVAAVAPSEQLTDGAFETALGQTLERLAQEHPEFMLAFGARQFTAVENEQLNPMRRLITIEAE